ncbi:UNVERIFIED_CONTAM: protein EARLY FLOWERING 5 [Sesamum calycinum]|uniref:Protein EARLY FLOWERING 5 n=1 Tax=Sesamum calycinum TaxID=2727403 RepID=A0AAW2NHR5_9LAMI
MNPTDAYRKELRKKELKRNKKERKKVREVGILKKDPETLREQIQKLEAMTTYGINKKIPKQRQMVLWTKLENKKRQLEDTLNLVLKKRKEYEDKMKEKGEAPVMFSHLGPVRRRATAEEEERVKHPRPEDSVYYHPTLNPSGAPPPGKPPMFKSSIGPRIPLPETSASNVASSSKSETEDSNLSVPPLPPPPPPLPSAISDSGDGSMLPTLPLPPPPQCLQSRENASKSDDSSSSNSIQMPTVLPPPPPPVGLPPKLGDNQPEGSSSESDMKGHFDAKEMLKMAPPPPPLRQQPPVPGAAMGPNLQPDVLPPGISRFPPPPPPTDMRPPLSAPGIAGQPVPPGVMVPLLPRPPFGPPPGPPPMMRPPLPPGPPPIPQDDLIARPSAPQKPSYVKSAASTVVKRPLAQHTPELTAMVPASVRVRRESALPKPKPKTPSTVLPSNRPIVAPPITRHESTGLSSAPKPQSIDDSYTAFLEDMKALGALDS